MIGFFARLHRLLADPDSPTSRHRRRHNQVEGNDAEKFALLMKAKEGELTGPRVEPDAPPAKIDSHAEPTIWITPDTDPDWYHLFPPFTLD